MAVKRFIRIACAILSSSSLLLLNACAASSTSSTSPASPARETASPATQTAQTAPAAAQGRDSRLVTPDGKIWSYNAFRTANFGLDEPDVFDVGTSTYESLIFHSDGRLPFVDYKGIRDEGRTWSTSGGNLTICEVSVCGDCDDDDCEPGSVVCNTSPYSISGDGKTLARMDVITCFRFGDKRTLVYDMVDMHVD